MFGRFGLTLFVFVVDGAGGGGAAEWRESENAPCTEHFGVRVYTIYMAPYT